MCSRELLELHAPQTLGRLWAGGEDGSTNRAGSHRADARASRARAPRLPRVEAVPATPMDESLTRFVYGDR